MAKFPLGLAAAAAAIVLFAALRGPPAAPGTPSLSSLRLLRASFAGKLSAIEQALNDGADPNAEGVSDPALLGPGATANHAMLSPLHLAIALRPAKPEVVAALIKAGALTTKRDGSPYGHTAWTLAAVLGSPKATFEALKDGSVVLEGFDAVNSRSGENNTALHYAYFRENPALAHFLLEIGADGRAHGAPAGATVLHMALKSKEKAHDLINVLMSSSEDRAAALTDKDDNGVDPLFAAVAQRAPARAVHALLEAHHHLNITVDVRDPKGITPLMVLATRGGKSPSKLDEEVLEMLLHAHIDLNAADEKGQTALMKAVKSGNHHACKKIMTRAEELGISEELKQARDAKGRTAQDLTKGRKMCE
jgi:ankyrin repeat protein